MNEKEKRILVAKNKKKVIDELVAKANKEMVSQLVKKEITEALESDNTLTGITVLNSEQVAKVLSIEKETLLLWTRQNRFPKADIKEKRYSRWTYETVKKWIEDKCNEPR